jgi:hypothetical protein
MRERMLTAWPGEQSGALGQRDPDHASAHDAGGHERVGLEHFDDLRGKGGDLGVNGAGAVSDGFHVDPVADGQHPGRVFRNEAAHALVGGVGNPQNGLAGRRGGAGQAVDFHHGAGEGRGQVGQGGLAFGGGLDLRGGVAQALERFGGPINHALMGGDRGGGAVDDNLQGVAAGAGDGEVPGVGQTFFHQRFQARDLRRQHGHLGAGGFGFDLQFADASLCFEGGLLVLQGESGGGGGVLAGGQRGLGLDDRRVHADDHVPGADGRAGRNRDFANESVPDGGDVRGSGFHDAGKGGQAAGVLVHHPERAEGEQPDGEGHEGLQPAEHYQRVETRIERKWLFRCFRHVRSPPWNAASTG